MCQLLVGSEEQTEGKASDSSGVHQQNNEQTREGVELSGQPRAHSDGADGGDYLEHGVRQGKSLYGTQEKSAGNGQKQVDTQHDSSFCEQLRVDASAKNIRAPGSCQRCTDVEQKNENSSYFNTARGGAGTASDEH